MQTELSDTEQQLVSLQSDMDALNLTKMQLADTITALEIQLLESQASKLHEYALTMEKKRLTEELNTSKSKLAVCEAHLNESLSLCKQLQEQAVNDACTIATMKQMIEAHAVNTHTLSVLSGEVEYMQNACNSATKAKDDAVLAADHL